MYYLLKLTDVLMQWCTTDNLRTAATGGYFYKKKHFNSKSKYLSSNELWLKVPENSSAIRQKGESQNKCYKKAKHAKF